MLLVEPATLLRRTVALSARSMKLATVHKAASHALALRLLKGTSFDEVLIAVDDLQGDGGTSAIGLLDQVDAPMLAALRARGVRGSCSSLSKRATWSMPSPRLPKRRRPANRFCGSSGVADWERLR